MNIRNATLSDVPAMHALRLSVKENVLVNVHKVTQSHYEHYLAQPNAAWVCEIPGPDGQPSLVGLAICDLDNRSIWGLFVAPHREGHGVGRNLLAHMTARLAELGPGVLRLSTEPGTRAEALYRAAGWAPKGMTDDGELKFEKLIT